MKKRWMAVVVAGFLLITSGAACAEGSWGSINQPLTRPEGWQDFVMDSAFSLGEAVEMDGVRVLSYGDYPVIDGSTVCVPMAMELARQHLDMAEEDLAGFVNFSTTHSAYERLIGGLPHSSVTVMSQNAMLDDTQPVTLFLGTAPSDEEQAMAEAAGVTLVMRPVCYDAFVFLVNAENPVDSLTVDQIRSVYTGETTHWQDVGGGDGFIHAYQRPKNSGSQTAMETLVMAGLRLQAESVYVSDGMGDLVRVVGDYSNGLNSLGYSFLYYVDVLYKSGAVKTLAVDGVTPTPEHLRSGEYPFTTCYYAVYREDDDQTAAFVDWLTGPEGQRCVAQAGYVPIIPAA